MKNRIAFCMAVFASITLFGQNKQEVTFNKPYQNIALDKSNEVKFILKLEKGGIYQFSILQQGIAVHYDLMDNLKKQVFECNIPEDIDGYEKFDYNPLQSGVFTLTVKRFDNPENTDLGKFTLLVTSLSKTEIAVREKNKADLVIENKKNVQTIDIDHFWEAYDQLKNCKTFADSTNSFQKRYLDRATDGLLDFIQVRDFTAEKFVVLVAKYPKFYGSIRKNTYQTKKAEVVIDSVFLEFKKLYPNFKPFKVCFAMGILNTGGTVSNNFVLIGAEVTTSTDDVDLSEFGGNEYSKNLSGKGDIVQKIKGMISHECVHTQQKRPTNADIKCELLYRVMREGFCDFIGTLVTGNKLGGNHEYGDKNEKQLWTTLKNELCNENTGNWLYNYSTVKDKPADLGYYIGYKIAEEYYKNAVDKKQAVVDIIEMTDPIKFLALSNYDQKATR